MGIFDSLYVPCPLCKKDVEVQTKEGPCLLLTFNFYDPNLPLWIMEVLNNKEVLCDHCDKLFRIKFDYEISRNGQWTEPVDNLDYVRWYKDIK